MMVPHAAQLLDRRLGSATALPCQPSWFSTFETPLPLIVLATIAVGSPGRRLGLGVRRVDLLDVVPVDLDRVPAERARRFA